MEKGLLKIARESKTFVHRLVKYQVFIDDVKVGTISNGEERIFEVTIGKHIIDLRMKWSTEKSDILVLDVSKDGMRLICGPNEVKERMKDMAAARFGIAGWLLRELTADKNKIMLPTIYLRQVNE